MEQQPHQFVIELVTSIPASPSLEVLTYDDVDDESPIRDQVVVLPCSCNGRIERDDYEDDLSDDDDDDDDERSTHHQDHQGPIERDVIEDVE